MPDWDRHLHFVVANPTFDTGRRRMEGDQDAAGFDLKYFFHRFDLPMASKLVELGYEIETELRADPDGGGGITPGTSSGFRPECGSAIAKNSRRHAARSRRRAGDPGGDRSARCRRARSAVDGGASQARGDVAAGQAQGSDAGGIARLLARADHARGRPAHCRRPSSGPGGPNPPPQNRAAEAMAYAIAHHFERNSVVDYHDLAMTAMERSMGAARPEDFEPEARGKACCSPGDQVSTRAVLDQEQRIIAFARAGKGTFRPLAAGHRPTAGTACRTSSKRPCGMSGIRPTG